MRDSGWATSQNSPNPPAPTGTRSFVSSGWTRSKPVYPSEEVGCLFGPHPHLGVAGATHESVAAPLHRQDVVGQQRAACLHQRSGQGALPALVRGEEGHRTPVTHNRRGVQRGRPLAFQPEGKHRTQEADLEQRIGHLACGMADDALGPDVEIRDPGEAQHVDCLQAVQTEAALTRGCAVGARVCRGRVLPAAADGSGGSTGEGQARSAGAGREPGREREVAGQCEAEDAVLRHQRSPGQRSGLTRRSRRGRRRPPATPCHAAPPRRIGGRCATVPRRLRIARAGR